MPHPRIAEIDCNWGATKHAPGAPRTRSLQGWRGDGLDGKPARVRAPVAPPPDRRGKAEGEEEPGRKYEELSRLPTGGLRYHDVKDLKFQEPDVHAIVR